MELLAMACLAYRKALDEADALLKKRAEELDRKPLPDNWTRVAPGTDAAIWRPWSRETGEL